MTQIPYVNKETDRKNSQQTGYLTASINSGLVELQHCLNKAMLMWQ